MSNSDRLRVIDEAALCGSGIFSVHVVHAREDAPIEFLKGVNFKTSFYGVINNTTGVLEYETPTYVEARMVAYLANRQVAMTPEEEAAAWPSPAALMAELPDLMN